MMALVCIQPAVESCHRLMLSNEIIIRVVIFLDDVNIIDV